MSKIIFKSLFLATALLAATSARAETYVAWGTDCKAGFSAVYSGYLQNEVSAAAYNCGGMGTCDMQKVASVNTSGCAPAEAAEYSPYMVIACKLCKRD